MPIIRIGIANPLRSHHRATVRPIYRKNVLVDTIRDLIASAERSGYKPGDIAIIARKNKALEKIKKSLDGFYLATSPRTLLIKDEVFIAIRDTFSLYVTNFHDPLALYRQLKRNGYELDIPVERDHMLESFLKYFNLPEPDLYDPDLLEIYEAAGSPVSHLPGHFIPVKNFCMPRICPMPFGPFTSFSGRRRNIRQ